MNGLTVQQILPPTPEVLVFFVASLFSDGKRLAHSTVKGYLAHVKALNRLLGFDCSAFECPRLQLAVKGYRRCRPSSKAKTRLPITISLLGAFLDALDPAHHEHILIAAVLSVGVYGLFRSGELTVKTRDAVPTCDLLTRGNAHWNDESVVIHLVSSKTDPFREGVDVVLHKNGSRTCPWTLLRLLWDSSTDDSANAPLFQHADASPLQYRELNNAIKALARLVGLDPGMFAGHSMRIGGATSLAMLGYSEHIIKALGRWTSLSYQAYARMTGGMRAAISKALAAPAEFRERNYFGGIEPAAVTKMSFDDIQFSFNSRKA